MADISDITAYLANVAFEAVYPNGTSQPSVAGIDCLIYEGWPVPEQLDMDLTGQMLDPITNRPIPRPNGPRANISIFPLMGNVPRIPQILDETYVITPPVFGMTVTVTAPTIGNTFVVTVNGVPGPTEFLTLDLDNEHAASSSGATVSAILSSLSTQIQAFTSPNRPLVPSYQVSIMGNQLLITGAAYCIARLGAQGTLGKVIFKERGNIAVTVWAHTQSVRTALAKAIDNVIKQSITIHLPDTSMALVVYDRTSVHDENEPIALYRRDLLYCVDYATVEQFPGYVVTSVNVQISPLDPVGQNFIATEVIG